MKIGGPNAHSPADRGLRSALPCGRLARARAMEANKNAARDCLRRATTLLREGDAAGACKFARKSAALYPTPEAEGACALGICDRAPAGGCPPLPSPPLLPHSLTLTHVGDAAAARWRLSPVLLTRLPRLARASAHSHAGQGGGGCRGLRGGRRGECPRPCGRPRTGARTNRGWACSARGGVQRRAAPLHTCAEGCCAAVSEVACLLPSVARRVAADAAAPRVKQAQSLYDVLQVARTATPEEVKKAYRKVRGRRSCSTSRACVPDCRVSSHSWQ